MDLYEFCMGHGGREEEAEGGIGAPRLMAKGGSDASEPREVRAMRATSASGQDRNTRGGIAQLVERRPCNWVVVFAGWMLSLLSGNDSIVYPNRWLTLSQKWGRGLEHAIQNCASCLLVWRPFRRRSPKALPNGDSPTAFPNGAASPPYGTVGGANGAKGC